MNGVFILAEGDIHILQGQKDLPSFLIQRTVSRQMRRRIAFLICHIVSFLNMPELRLRLRC